jgi:ABC-type dipeptide/oligopeptide/nickel transport system permease subunit
MDRLVRSGPHDHLLASPSTTHPFGTDQLGRDQLSRVLSAARVAVVVALVPTALALIAGSALGIAAGLVGGACDFVVMRAMEVLFSFPALVLAIIFVAVLGPGLDNAMYAIAIVYVPRFAVMARSSTRAVRDRPYMGAARLAGVGSLNRAFRHVLPNIRGPLIVLFALSTSTVQLTYATLSFLGLGLAPPSADFGSMLFAGAPLFTSDPWLVIFPAVALVGLIVMLNGVGDCLREFLEPA